MKTTFLSLVALLVLNACGKAEDKTATNPLVGNWAFVSGPVTTTGFTYQADGHCALTLNKVTLDSCSYDGTTLKVTSSTDGLTDTYAVTLNGNSLSILLAKLPETYRFSFVRQ